MENNESNQLEKVVQVLDVRKTFRVGNEDVEVLKGITFDIFKGEFVVILGPSGCGKSTLLHTILGLEGPTSGRINVLGTDIYSQPSEDFRSEFRKKNIGMVYQQANWIRSLNVRENISFPLVLMGVDKGRANNASLRALDNLGMKDWAEYYPTELSSGQQQRISLARALINDPKIIVADEPTGNLDYQSGVMVMELLSKMSNEMQKTVIMVTHDLEYIKYSTRVVKIFDGALEGVFTGADKDKIMSSVKLKRGVGTDEMLSSGTPDITDVGQEVATEVAKESAAPSILKGNDDDKTA